MSSIGLNLVAGPGHIVAKIVSLNRESNIAGLKPEQTNVCRIYAVGFLVKKMYKDHGVQPPVPGDYLIAAQAPHMELPITQADMDEHRAMGTRWSKDIMGFVHNSNMYAYLPRHLAPQEWLLQDDPLAPIGEEEDVVSQNGVEDASDHPRSPTMPAPPIDLPSPVRADS